MQENLTNANFNEKGDDGWEESRETGTSKQRSKSKRSDLPPSL